MLAENAGKTTVHYALDFAPQLGCGIGEVANKIMHAWGQPSAATSTANAFIQLRWKESLQAFDLTPTRLAWQALSLSSFIDGANREKHFSLIADAVKVLNVKDFKRVGIKVNSFLPLEMSHAEMCRLFFGTVLAPLDFLEGALGQPKDPFIRIDGTYDKREYVLILSAMSEEQIGLTVRSFPISSTMIVEGFPDSAFADFFENITAKPALYFDVDLFTSDVPSGSVRQFFTDALAVADKLATAATRILQSKPVTMG